MRPSEMKTQSPSGGRGRAGVRSSNLPPWLPLLCMVIYIKGEPAMQVGVPSTLTAYHDGQFRVGLVEASRVLIGGMVPYATAGADSLETAPATWYYTIITNVCSATPTQWLESLSSLFQFLAVCSSLPNLLLVSKIAVNPWGQIWVTDFGAEQGAFVGRMGSQKLASGFSRSFDCMARERW